MDYDVVVVGGGAAGLMAACTAAERGLQVLLLEKMDQTGRKRRITGKGRCNLTNTASLRDTLPHIGSSTAGATNKPGRSGGVWLRNAYGRFFNHELMQWFEEREVPLVEERGGRVFPASGKSLDIFLALMHQLEASPNVSIRKNATVKRIETFEGHATAALLQNGERIACRRIILATGGLSYPTTGSTGAGLRMARELGHTVVDPVPSLVPLRCHEAIPDELVGFVLKNVQLSVLDGQQSLYVSPVGELTFCADGLAGPLTLSASRLATRALNEGRQLVARLDLKPALAPDQLDRRLQADIDQNGTRIFNDALRLWLPAELIPLALRQLHIEYYKRLHQITGDERRRLGRWLKGAEFQLTATHDWNEAIVTQGGVALSEVDPKTMESKLVAGLYIVGEMLDLDADTGGYNLQIAFSTAHAAGQAV